MFCSGCGQALTPGLAFCPQCGRPMAPAVPPVPGLQFQLESYAGKVKALSICWFIYAALSVALGFAGMAFAHAFFSGTFGPWMRGPLPPTFLGPALMHLIWVAVLVRGALAAILSLLKFPFGTALGIWTLVVLLGYRNSTLYEQL